LKLADRASSDPDSDLEATPNSGTDSSGSQSAIHNPQSAFPQSAIRNPQSAFVRAEGLTRTYNSGPNSVTVFEGLSLELQEGEMVAIVGPSGAGKSTLLHLLGGLDRPTSGSIKLGEFDIFKLADVDLARFRNREIGFIFQFHHLLPEFTALENAMMPLLIGRWPMRSAGERAASVLTRVGLSARSTHRPGNCRGRAGAGSTRQTRGGPRSCSGR
jgi:predicted ABC-type transport system involved in lysophospholipase L1 biosynthesis ATPase subunit